MAFRPSGRITNPSYTIMLTTTKAMKNRPQQGDRFDSTLGNSYDKADIDDGVLT
jgi:hypothetical protein